MQVRVLWHIRFRRWLGRVARKIGRAVPTILIGIVIMLIVSDGVAVYSARDITADIATSAAVLAYQAVEQGESKTAAEKQASALLDRHLARLDSIEFRDRTVEVTTTYRARTLLLKNIPWVSDVALITASGSWAGR